MMRTKLNLISFLSICCGVLHVTATGQLYDVNSEQAKCPTINDSCRNITWVPKTDFSCESADMNSTAYHGIQCVVTRGECLNITLEHLHTNITNFQLIVDMLPSENVSFQRFSSSLRRLAILWTGQVDGIILSDKSNLSDPDLLKGLHKLESLTISIPVNDMHGNLLYDLFLLKNLDLSNIGALTSAQFAYVYKNSLLSLKPLKCLILKRISGVDLSRDRLFMLKDLFSEFNESKVEVLDISHNRDIYLYPGFTNAVPYIQRFSIAGNSVRYVGDPLEASCMLIELFLHKELRNANLDDLGPFANPITIIQAAFGAPLINCLGVFPNGCVCKTLQSVCGDFLPKGRVYDCSHVPDYTLTDLLLSPNCPFSIALPLPMNLQSLSCSGTQLEFRFVKFGNKTICFMKNQLRVFDASRLRFHLAENSYHIDGFNELEVFNISHSDWGYFFHDPVFLHNFHSLKVLDMTKTNIGVYIKNDTENTIFRCSNTLRALYLKHATITYIPGGEFKQLINLEVLDLSENGLRTITFDMANLISLKFIDLSRNDFHQLSQGFIAKLHILTAKSHHRKPLKIDFQFNKIICDCDSLDFLMWIKSQSIVEFTRIKEYRCIYRNLGNVRMSSIDLNTVVSNCYLIYIVVGSLSLFFLIIVIVIVLMYRYKWKFRLFLLKLMNYKNVDEDEMFDYDGFVVYTDQDRYFVHTTLLDKVEKEMNMKLCIHHRDFVPGHGIDENIVNAIDTSRRTLLILTEAFLKSSWCEYETSVARNKLPVEGRDVIVPILLAELPKEKITPSIKNILREQTYVKWETSLEGQEYFWKKLEISLRSKRVKRTPHSSESCDNSQLIQPTEDFMSAS